MKRNASAVWQGGLPGQPGSQRQDHDECETQGLAPTRVALKIRNPLSVR